MNNLLNGNIDGQIATANSNLKAINALLSAVQSELAAANKNIENQEASELQLNQKLAELNRRKTLTEEKRAEALEQVNRAQGKVSETLDVFMRATNGVSVAKENLNRLNSQKVNVQNAVKHANERVERARAELAAAEAEQAQAESAASNF